MVSEVERLNALVPTHLPPPVTGGRALVLHDPPPRQQAAVEIDDGDSVLPAGLNVRNASPRQISNVSLDLYAAGLISFEDYTALAFQAELHPDSDRTIGALTGERAQPDRRRDFVLDWHDRLQFELRHNTRDSAVVKQTSRIFSLLKGLAEPTRLSI
jgi:hypothetical protein